MTTRRLFLRNSGLAMVGALYGLQGVVFAPLAAMPGLRWLGLGLLVSGGAFVYGLCGQVLGAFDLLAMARRRRIP